MCQIAFLPNLVGGTLQKLICYLCSLYTALTIFLLGQLQRLCCYRQNTKNVVLHCHMIPNIIKMKEFVHAVGVKFAHLKIYKGCKCVPGNGVEKTEAKS